MAADEKITPMNKLMTPELREHFRVREREFYDSMPNSLWLKLIAAGTRKALIEQACRKIMSKPFYHNLAVYLANLQPNLQSMWRQHFHSFVTAEYHRLRHEQSTSTK